MTPLRQAQSGHAVRVRLVVWLSSVLSMLLLVGLGNPGPRYAGHRHNVGFMAVDEIVRRRVFQPWRGRFNGLVTEGHLGGERTLVLKPQTFMNESSKAVGEAVRFLKIPLDRVVVFHDELDIAPDQGSGEFAAAPRGEVDVVEVVVVEAFDDVLDELFGEVEE